MSCLKVYNLAFFCGGYLLFKHLFLFLCYITFKN